MVKTMKIIALANDPESLEKLINDYFYSKSYYIELDKRNKIEYKIKNTKSKEIENMINENFKIKYKKGKYYFYKDEESTK